MSYVLPTPTQLELAQQIDKLFHEMNVNPNERVKINSIRAYLYELAKNNNGGLPNNAKDLVQKWLACNSIVNTETFLACINPDGSSAVLRKESGGANPGQTYFKSNRFYVGRDGIKRVLYMRGGKSYVKKKDPKIGKFVYRQVKA